MNPASAMPTTSGVVIAASAANGCRKAPGHHDDAEADRRQERARDLAGHEPRDERAAPEPDEDLDRRECDPGDQELRHQSSPSSSA